MSNSNLQFYTHKFFDELEMFEDTKRGHHYKTYLKSCVDNFLNNENRDTAFEVYKAFFDSYRIDMPGENNPFTDIILILEEYENTAASLIDSQRDHFIHAVNVFLTGLSIYAQNTNYKKAFEKAILQGKYKDFYTTKNEEFFYRWGIAALLHDIGYPIEIVGNQINRFLRIVSDADGEDIRTKAVLTYTNFDELNCIKQIKDLEKFAEDFLKQYPEAQDLDVSKPIDLMSLRIHESLGTDLMKTKAGLDKFTETMGKSGFIDHGYFSAIIVLKWYGALVQLQNFNSNYFFWPVLDSATAILLHNYFKNVIRKDEYAHGPMKPEENPIAFLLILCDEMQEWNRTARGIKTKKKVLADSANFSVSEDYFAVSYFSETQMEEGFSKERKDTFYHLLDMDSLFAKGVTVDNIARKNMASINTARPMMDSIERLAVAIHMKYNEKRLKDFPDQSLAYPEFSSLPDDLKYSNMRQAIGIYDKLASIGCCLAAKTGSSYILSIDDIEMLAEREHEEWVNDRIIQGWSFGEKDVEKKTTPYLVPYDQLTEQIKDYDRDAIRNIPILADMLGMEIKKI